MMMATGANGEVPGEKKEEEQRNASTSPWTPLARFRPRPSRAAAEEEEEERSAPWSLPCSAWSRALLCWVGPTRARRAIISNHHSGPSLTPSRKAGKLAPRGGNREGDALALAGRETRSLSALPAFSSSWPLSASQGPRLLFASGTF
nr:unnamed protein product [Digitaria exilis]